MTSENPYP